MKRLLVHQLAKLHTTYDIYLESQMIGEVRKNIIEDIEEFEELRYLSYFYYEYFEEYLCEKNGGRLEYNYFKGDFRSRSLNLPYLGRNTITEEKVSHFFIFRGSLQEKDQLSMTALSCFWLFNEEDLIDHLYEKYDAAWRYYHPFVQKIGITKEIIENSYVTDLYRVSDSKGRVDLLRCKQLLGEEIQLLQPEVIVLVGSEARNAFQQEIQSQPDKFLFVPYTIKGDEEPYRVVRKKLAHQYVFAEKEAQLSNG